MGRPENKERAKNAEKGLYYCSKCKQFLSRDQFYKSAGNKYGLYCYCISCSKILRANPKKLEFERKSEKGLYYCNNCKKYLPRHFFTPVKFGKFGLRNMCKPCFNILKNKSNQKVKVIIPYHLRRDIKFLMLYYNKSVEEILMDLITKSFNAIMQKPQK
jgi:hypothetical protein